MYFSLHQHRVCYRFMFPISINKHTKKWWRFNYSIIFKPLKGMLQNPTQKGHEPLNFLRGLDGYFFRMAIHLTILTIHTIHIILHDPHPLPPSACVAPDFLVHPRPKCLHESSNDPVGKVTCGESKLRVHQFFSQSHDGSMGRKGIFTDPWMVDFLW